jgi:hypothetical protein
MKDVILVLAFPVISLAVSAMPGTAGAPIQDCEPLQDFTAIKLEDSGIKPVEPKEDPHTGFIVGGKNKTEQIKKLTEINGKSIAELEKAMRPGEASTAGFLGKQENLLDVMAADNKYVVDQMGLTHQELAKHLHAMAAVWDWQFKNKQEEAEFLYNGQKFKIKVVSTRGFQDSPFADGTKSGADATVQNLTSGKKLEYGLLVPYMIERYGFYEGQGTSYRVDPRKVVEVFDLVKKSQVRADAETPSRQP